MLLSALALSVATILVPSFVRGQGDLSAANNVTDLEGTWSSNNAISTGGRFCTPAQMKFEYPTNTGISYSFTNDGHFEEAQYRYEANASNPSCIQAVILWQHGTYKLNNDGSLTLTPFPTDGRIQVQNPCAAVSNVITYYNQVTQYKDWGIIIDVMTGGYQLRMNRFDGAKMPYMNLIAKPPNMLPPQVLTGVNASGQIIQTRKRSTSPLNIFKRSAAPARLTFSKEVIAGGVAGTSLIALGLSML